MESLAIHRSQRSPASRVLSWSSYRVSLCGRLRQLGYFEHWHGRTIITEYVPSNLFHSTNIIKLYSIPSQFTLHLICFHPKVPFARVADNSTFQLAISRSKDSSITILQIESNDSGKSAQISRIIFIYKFNNQDPDLPLIIEIISSWHLFNAHNQGSTVPSRWSTNPCASSEPKTICNG